MPHDCFADEIAIDFPSVEPAVERMRAAFGEHAPDRQDDVHRTELRVTPQEASGGLVVPIDVPVQGLCHHCGGRGEVWAEPCAVCAGTGVWRANRSVRVSLPPGVRSGARIRFRVSSPGLVAVRVEVRVAVSSAV